jgi:phosphinothricin acetyltransferase
MAPLIRLARPEDIEGIFAIYDEHVLRGTATAQTTPFTPEERRAWFDRHPAGLHPLMVAEADGGVAGWAGLAAWSPREAYRRSAESSVYVATGWHGRGLGRALMERLMEHTRDRTPVRVLIARPLDANAASIRLHESLGFVTVGVLRGVMEKFGELHDVRIMQRELDAPGGGEMRE